MDENRKKAMKIDTPEMETKGGIPDATVLPPKPEEVERTGEELSLIGLQCQIDELRTDVAQIKAHTGTPRVRTQAEVDTLLKEQAAEKALTSAQKTEKEIRRYVRFSGGYRKDISKSEKALAGRLLKKLGRDTKDPNWDTGLL